MKYIVKRVISNSWEVGFHDIDDNDKKTPTVFDTAEAAEKEIQSYLAEDMKDCERRNALQVEALECPGCGAFVEECNEYGSGVLCRKCAMVEQRACSFQSIDYKPCDHALQRCAIGEPTHEPRS